MKAVEGRRAEAKKKLDAHDATLSAIKAKQQAESAAIDVLRKQAEGDVPEEPEVREGRGGGARGKERALRLMC